MVMHQLKFIRRATYSFMTIYYYKLAQSLETRANIALKKVKIG